MTALQRARGRERSRERNGDRDKEKKTMKEKATRKRGDDDDDEDGGRRPRVYNSPPGSLLLLDSSPGPFQPGYTSSSLQGHSCPHFPWQWGFFRGLTRERRLVVARPPSVSRPTTLGPNPHLRLEVDTRFSASLYLFAL